MCLHVSLYWQIGSLFDYTCIREFHTCIGCRHTVWFLPTVCCQFCYFLFADALFCTLCFVSIILNCIFVYFIEY